MENRRRSSARRRTGECVRVCVYAAGREREKRNVAAVAENAPAVAVGRSVWGGGKRKADDDDDDTRDTSAVRTAAAATEGIKKRRREKKFLSSIGCINRERERLGKFARNVVVVVRGLSPSCSRAAGGDKNS